jgi:hypothetical protein
MKAVRLHAYHVGVVVQRRATSWRCQRWTVDGVMSNPRRRRAGSSRARAAIRPRSGLLIRGRGVRGPWSTASWWRRTRISISLVVSDRVRKYHPAQELGEHEVDQGERHRRIMPVPGWRRSSRSGLCAQFRAPTGRTRPPHRRLHHLEGPQGRRDQPRSAPGPVPPGDSSWQLRPTRSLQSTSPTSTRSSCAASTFWW